MKLQLSAPIFVLKSEAKELKRTTGVTLLAALNQIARLEGFSSWSLLLAKAESFRPQTREEILEYINPGDLLLVASRPGQGKTIFTLRLLVQALAQKRKCFFFTLDYTRKEVAARLAAIDETICENHPLLKLDFSDEISAAYIVQKTRRELTPGSLIAIDFLQLLDQRRTKPALQAQVEQLKDFAKEQKCIVILISQIDRAFDQEIDRPPKLADVRLPNPVDLNLFNKSLLLHKGRVKFAGPREFEVVLK